MTSLLPPNATRSERAIGAATARPVPVPVGDLWNPATCPAALLPWLAWALSVDDWDPDWSDEAKRATIAASLSVHRRKGTVWAMREALRAAGLGDADIQEGWSANRFDGSFTRDGSRDRQQSDHWAEYRVVLSRHMSVAQAARARSILTAAAPVRCHLRHMTFEQAALLYNGAVTRDGQYTRGIV
ncbi:phage tail protein I [Paracoccus sp. (in: a-proteobacteria)]|uniref:phage tail protein I n=1 Tax=Paracoccus sp. TaxID=267 RepID=UPI002AFE14AD|nr:phage tail protein I [Paracoccus sp. (in: a-proteobacteria)]